jgi:hypothetical protein
VRITLAMRPSYFSSCATVILHMQALVILRIVNANPFARAAEVCYFHSVVEFVFEFLSADCGRISSLNRAHVQSNHL